jgi:ribonucleoside-diphosphate reductase alpha chain
MKLDWIKGDQKEFLGNGYLREGESISDRYNTICDSIDYYVNKMSEGKVPNSLQGIGDRFRGYIENNWPSFSTPVLRNFGAEDNLSISCNISVVPDSLEGISKTLTEIILLAKNGSGTAVDFSNIRPIGSNISTGGKSNSVMDWVELYADAISKVNQNAQRRGFLTAYLSLDHPEIEDFLKIGTHSMPDEKQRFFQTITTGVVIPEGWRDDLRTNPAKKRLFSRILDTRSEIGFPYIFDLTNANKGAPSYMQELGLKIKNSNICSEISGYTSGDKSFACCLSSVNALKYDEWKDHPHFLNDMYIMLDCVIEEYIEQTKGLVGFNRARKFAIEHRAVGLGVIGFHSLLQKNNLPIGSLGASRINVELFSKLHDAGETSSKFMASVWGEAPVIKGYGYRNTQRQAQAPTKSTAFIMGGTAQAISEGIEVHKSNYSEKKLAKIQVEFKNNELRNLLKSKGKDTEEVWKSISINNGSVSKLDFLTDHEKNVFKTFEEVSQVDLVNLAASRQKYITQGQSLNVMVPASTPRKYLLKLYIEGLENGIKGFYYQYNINAAQEFNKELMTCSNCEG